MKYLVTGFATFIYFFTLSAQPSLPVIQHKTIVIAHRGDHTQVPENTLDAYRQAIEHGADYVEVDLRTTKDGKLVVMHDATVNRMTNGVGSISELTFSQLRALHVGNRNDTSSYHYQVPLFSEVLFVCKGHINIYLDFKEADVAETYREIVKAAMQKHVIVYLNKDDQYQQWKNIAPGMPLMCSLPDTVKSVHSLNSFLGVFSVNLLDGSLSDYTSEMLRFAKDNNIGVWLDVQSVHEGPADWDKLLAKGINAMQTDHPEKLIAYLRLKGIR